MSRDTEQRQLLLSQLIHGQIDQATYERRLSELDRGVRGGGLPSGRPLGQGGGPVAATPRAAMPAPARHPQGDALRAGELLDNRFRIRDPLGKGGMGEVWRAYDTVSDVQVVVKVLPRHLQANPTEIARVQQAFRRVNPLQHQHICPVHYLGQDAQLGYFLVMKYIEGTTLREFHRTRGRLSLVEVCRILAPVAAALDYAHKNGVVHRDIKPDNIMLAHDGSDPQIVDFGLAANADAAGSFTAAADRAGTLPYLAPEQWQKQSAGPASDQYALAVVAYELLAGRLPFADRDAKLLMQQVLSAPPPAIAHLPVEVQTTLARGLAKSTTARFASCQDFIKSLQSVKVPALPPGFAPPLPVTPPLEVGRSGELPQLPGPRSGPTLPLPPTTTKVPGTSGEVPQLPWTSPQPSLAGGAVPPPRLTLGSSREMPLLPVPAPASVEIVSRPAPAVGKSRLVRAFQWLLGAALVVAPAAAFWWKNRPESNPSVPSAVADTGRTRNGADAEIALTSSSNTPDDAATSDPDALAGETSAEEVTAPIESEIPVAATSQSSGQTLPTANSEVTLAPIPADTGATASLVGLSQLAALFNQYGLGMNALKSATFTARAGVARVSLNPIGDVQAIEYARTSPAALTDSVVGTFSDARGQVYRLQVDVRIDSAGRVSYNWVRLDSSNSTSRGVVLYGTTAGGSPGPSPSPIPVPTPVPGPAPMPKTDMAETGSLPLSLVSEQVSVSHQAWPFASGTWLPAVPYEDAGGASRLDLQLYAPQDRFYAVSGSGLSTQIVEVLPFRPLPRPLAALGYLATQRRLNYEEADALSADTQVDLARCVLRVIGTSDDVAVGSEVRSIGEKLLIHWKSNATLRVPPDIPADLTWRLFIRWTPWEERSPRWVEIEPAGSPSGDHLRFNYRWVEPASWGNGFGARKHDVRLKELTFHVDQEVPAPESRQFVLRVQGVPTGWVETFASKEQAVAGAAPADARTLNYELAILRALTSTSGRAGNGFDACLVGYETLTGPRRLSDDGSTIDDTDRIDVARVCLGRPRTDLPGNLLVRPSRGEASP